MFHSPVVGSYNSALLVMGPVSKLMKPAATRTLPFGSSVAVWSWRVVLRLPVTLHAPVAGSYSSALLRLPALLAPPATRTCPLGNSVDVWSKRATLRLPVTLHVPVAGSYSSAVLRALSAREPPAIRTLPLASSVAV